MRRICVGVPILVLIVHLPAMAQSSATVTGLVVDTTGAVLAGARVVLTNSATSLTRHATSGPDGAIVVTTLPPGKYVLKATLDGFTPAELRDIVLNVNDRVAVRVEMQVGGIGEGVTVSASAERVNTSPAVSTVVDRQFVENLPLNGRSLQSLLELTPGVVLTQVGNPTEGGQFSVNGQRSNANYFMVDGVSANVGISAGLGILPGQSVSGSLPGMTALGGTNGLVSVDALQEFRIQTSTYAPEFGRTPGGQISLLTRSGTNVLHGSLFEYFRDESLDATDWFTKYRGLAKPELRQHNFGGVLGGPILRNKTFFFASYEGLRLKQPRTWSHSTPGLEARRTAPAGLQPYLNAFPLPNGPELTNGYALFSASYSDPARFDGTSLRVDHSVSGDLTVFGRFSHTPSYREVRSTSGSLSQVNTTHQDNDAVTLGSTWILSNRAVHDVRVNYTQQSAPFTLTPTEFGGAALPPVGVFAPGHDPAKAQFTFSLSGGPLWSWGVGTAYRQRQFNVVDSLTITSRAHEFKFGVDYRRTHPVLSGEIGTETLQFLLPDVPTSRARLYSRQRRNSEPNAVAFDNLSVFAQDNWRLNRRLTLTYGIRWELVPPPHATQGSNAITLENLDDPYGGQVHLAPRDTPLWNTRYNNFAPRIGASYVVSDRAESHLVVRGGFGMFHDLGFGQVGTAYVGYPFFASKQVNAPLFPLSAANLAPPELGVDPPTQLWIVDRDVSLPYTYQWNVSAERAIGIGRSLTVSYVGAEGRRLLKLDRYRVRLLDWATAASPMTLSVNRNNGYSDYHALQFQFQQRLRDGLQAMASYTLGRSRDTGSSDALSSIPAERLPAALDYGYSDYDVRHVLTAAVTYQIGELAGRGMWRQLARDWGVDVMLRARSAFPIAMSAIVPFPPDNEAARPNVVPGQPFWIDDPSVPAERRLNRAAFSIPPDSTQGDLLRGSVRGFNAHQVDLALRRDFPLVRSVRLQFRIEAFNLLNTVNFQNPSGQLSNATFGVSPSTLASGFGGLNALYQVGGPRSLQLAVKMLF